MKLQNIPVGGVIKYNRRNMHGVGLVVEQSENADGVYIFPLNRQHRAGDNRGTAQQDQVFMAWDMHRLDDYILQPITEEVETLQQEWKELTGRSIVLIGNGEKKEGPAPDPLSIRAANLYWD